MLFLKPLVQVLSLFCIHVLLARFRDKTNKAFKNLEPTASQNDFSKHLSVNAMKTNYPILLKYYFFLQNNCKHILECVNTIYIKYKIFLFCLIFYFINLWGLFCVFMGDLVSLIFIIIQRFH